MIAIDAHQHVWDLGFADYAWPNESVPALHRTIEFSEILADLAQAGINGTILVQAADTAAETRRLLAVGDEYPQVVGVVGWIPLDRPAEAEQLVMEFTADDRFVGTRSLIHTYPDPEWILRPAAFHGLALLERTGLTYDVVTADPRALDIVPVLSERYPALRIVIDHLGKPPLGEGSQSHLAWRTRLARAAENPLAHAKLSGLYASRGPLESWTTDELRPVVADALELFGPERLMFGGDWPVSLLAGGHHRGWAAITSLIDELTPEHHATILGGTAARFYQIDPRRLRVLRSRTS